MNDKPPRRDRDWVMALVVVGLWVVEFLACKAHQRTMASLSRHAHQRTGRALRALPARDGSDGIAGGVTHHRMGWRRDQDMMQATTDCFAELLQPTSRDYASERWRDVTCRECFRERFEAGLVSLSVRVAYCWSIRSRPIATYLKKHPTLPIAVATLVVAVATLVVAYASGGK